MPSNVGKFDRVVRVAIGIALLGQLFSSEPNYAGWFGIAPLMTGLVGVCPLYAIFGRLPR